MQSFGSLAFASFQMRGIVISCSTSDERESGWRAAFSLLRSTVGRSLPSSGGSSPKSLGSTTATLIGSETSELQTHNMEWHDDSPSLVDCGVDAGWTSADSLGPNRFRNVRF